MRLLPAGCPPDDRGSCHKTHEMWSVMGLEQLLASGSHAARPVRRQSSVSCNNCLPLHGVRPRTQNHEVHPAHAGHMIVAVASQLHRNWCACAFVDHEWLFVCLGGKFHRRVSAFLPHASRLRVAPSDSAGICFSLCIPKFVVLACFRVQRTAPCSQLCCIHSSIAPHHSRQHHPLHIMSAPETPTKSRDARPRAVICNRCIQYINDDLTSECLDRPGCGDAAVWCRSAC